MKEYKLNTMSETAILFLFETAEIMIDNKHKFEVLGDIEPKGQAFKHGGIRIKISPSGGDTHDKSRTSTFPIDTSEDLPKIRYKDIRYGKDLKATEKSRQLDAAKAVISYAFSELEDLYKYPDTGHSNAFTKTLEEFNKLDKATKKYYIALGGIS